MRYVLSALGAFWLCAPTAFAGPKVAVVVGPDAPKLEKFAADELASRLKELFDAEVTVSDKLPATADHLVLVGSPKTNPQVAKAVGDRWPKLSDQGHVLRSAKLGDRSALVVGGGNPVATLWAVYEFGHHFGVRSFLHGDVMPEKVPDLKFDGFDVTLEPAVKVRAWQVFVSSQLAFAAWGLDDYKRLFAQLAKLKFTHVAIGVNPENPTMLLDVRRFPVSGDTPGRKAFKGAKEFVNPALADKKTDVDRKAAVLALAKQIGETAPEFGLTSGFGNPEQVGEFPGNRRGMLPRVSGRLHASQNFVVVAEVPGDLSPAVYFLARRAFEPELTEQDAYTQFFTPMLGSAATKRVLLGFEMIDKANALIWKHDPRGVYVSPHSIPQLLGPGGVAELPEWWKEAGKLYGGAMNEMYRGIRATFNDPARPALLYYAKRCEFAVHYFAALESAGSAAVAKKKGENDALVAHLEKATESVYNALTALGDVARDTSDRGVIAVLAEDAYRPLTAALKAAEKK